MFLISETVSLSFFISISIFLSFSSFTGSGFASSHFIFSCWFAKTHVLHSKSMFMPNSFIPDNALSLCCQMHSSSTWNAIKRLLSCIHIAIASFACIFRHYGGVFILISSGGASGHLWRK